MSAVVRQVEKAAKTIGNAIGDTVDFVVDTVENTLEAALDDPVKTIVQVAAVATGNAWALPLIEGVDVLEEGGSIEDAFKSAAVVYATGKAVSFASDAFSAAGATSSLSGSGTTSFFDDGSSIQFFDDGSRLITDSAGAVTSAPAIDVITPGLSVGAADAAVSMAQPSTSLNPDLMESVSQTAAPSVAEAAAGSGRGFFGDMLSGINRGFKSVADGINNIFNDFENPFDSFSSVFEAETPTTIVDTTNYFDQSAFDYAGEGYYEPPPSQPSIAGAAEAAAENAGAAMPPEPQYNTMEELLLDKGAITPEQAVEAMSPPQMVDIDQAVQGASQSSAGQQPPVDIDQVDQGAAQSAADQQPDVPVEDRSISYVPDDVGPPVVDRSFQPGELPPAVDRPLSESLLDLAGSAGQTAVNFAVDNPITTAALVGAVAGGADQTADQTTSEPAKKTYTYGVAEPIRRTGLQELYSAAASIYGDRGAQPQIAAPAQAPQFQSSFQPLLTGQAPGARAGLAGLSYTPMGAPQSFDISNLTPEQIVQIQDMINRRRQQGGGG